jgi:hypothetical protein
MTKPRTPTTAFFPQFMLCLAAALAAACYLPLAAAQAPGAAPGVMPSRRADTPPDRDQVERQLQSVRTLIEGSSAARQIEASGNAEAQGLRNKARQLRRLAEEAFGAGDLRSASGLLDDASRQMFEGVRMLAGERDKTENQAAALTTRMESARALLSAQKRISAEKPAAGAADTARRIEGLLNEARDHLAAQRLAQAQPLVDQAYLIAKASIGAMRGGDTLVRSLHFASKEEEYHYEVDRNDTHQMLLKVLVQKQAGEAGGAREFVERAAALRRDADAAGKRGDYAAAIRLLEDATRELVRAIRGAGVFIPG